MTLVALLSTCSAIAEMACGAGRRAEPFLQNRVLFDFAKIVSFFDLLRKCETVGQRGDECPIMM